MYIVGKAFQKFYIHIGYEYRYLQICICFKIKYTIIQYNKISIYSVFCQL